MNSGPCKCEQWPVKKFVSCRADSPSRPEEQYQSLVCFLHVWDECYHGSLDPVFFVGSCSDIGFCNISQLVQSCFFCSILSGRYKTAARLRPELGGEIRTTRDRSETTPWVFGHVYFKRFMTFQICMCLETPTRPSAACPNAICA